MEINKVYIPLLTDTNRYLILFGGAGSGKSVFASQKILIRLTTESNHRFLVVRKVKDTIRGSVYQIFCDLIYKYDLESEFQINKSEFRITHLPTGNEILFIGLDKNEKMKSIQGITGVWLEECTELTSEDFDQLDLRIRGQTTNYKQIILSFNPVDEKHWLKKSFFDNQSDNVTILKTTYKDNAYIDDDYLRVLNERIAQNPNLERIYKRGEWGIENNTGNFYKRFVHSKSVKYCEYNEDLPLHISFDFNVNPGVSLTIWQTTDKEAKCINEIFLPYPKNSTSDTCKEFVKQYFKHKAGLYIYGDASGMNSDNKIERGFNHYTIIQEELKMFHPIMRVQSKNPSLVMRGLFINRFFDSGMSGINLLISETCKNLIEDLSYVKESSSGGKFKQMYKNESNVLCQKYGHLTDTLDYFICSYYDVEYNSFLVGGKKLDIQYGSNPTNFKTRW